MAASSSSTTGHGKFQEQAGINGIRMLETADSRMRSATSKGGGDSLVATLLAGFTDQMEPHSQGRMLVERTLDLLADQKLAAAKGEFAQVRYPANLADKALESLRAQPHRAVYAKARLKFYLEPDGVSTDYYVRDRLAMQLIPATPEQVATSKGLNPTTAAPAASTVPSITATARNTMTTMLLSTLERYSLAVEDQLKHRRTDLPIPVDARPTPRQLEELTVQEETARMELYEFMDIHANTQEVRQFQQNLTGTPFDTSMLFTEEGGDGAALNPLEADDIAKFKTLIAANTTAEHKLQQARELEQKWKDYVQVLTVNTAVDGRVKELLKNSQQVIDQLNSTEPPAPATAAAATPTPTAARVMLVQGFLHPSLGVVISPNLLIYYAVRAILEAVYQLAGDLNETQYRHMKPDPGMPLSSWGGKVRQSARCFPDLSDETHRTIYLNGVMDAELREMVTEYRRFHPEQCMDLEALIQQTEIIGDAEIKILREASQDMADPEKRRKSEIRLRELADALSGAKNTTKNSHKTGTAAAAGLSHGAKDKGVPKPGGKVPTSFSNARQYNQYAKAPCIIHPNAAKPHSNGECMAQKPQLKQAVAAMVAQPTALLAQYGDRSNFMHQQALSTVSTHTPWQGAEWGMVGYTPGPPSVVPSIASSSYSTLPPSASMVAGWQPGADYGMAASTVKQMRQQGLQQAAASRSPGAPFHSPQQPGHQGPRGPGGAGRGGGPPAAGQAIPLDGGLEMPPPPPFNRNCEHCGHASHAPLPCAYRYPHLAPPHFKAPRPDGYRPEIFQMYQEAMRKMPPGMQLGGKLAAWLQRYRQQLLPQQQQRVQGFVNALQAAQPQPAAIADWEYEYGYSATDRTFEEALYADSYEPPLFINQPPPVFVLPRGQNCDGDSNWQEYAAAFPLSFVQTGAAQPPPPRSPTATTDVPSPAQLRQLVEQMQSCIKRVEEALGTQPARPANTEHQQSAAAAATTQGAPRKVRWADELQDRQQQQLAGNLQPLARELQDLMHQHGVKAGSSDPTGLYAIRLELTKERRYTLDRFENHSPQTGFSLVLPNGQLVTPPKAISDSGCTFSLVDKAWADSVGWRYRPTRIRLVLADNTCSRVTGITEPAWGMIAAGTPQEGRALIQALVVEGAGDTFQLAVGKEHMALHSACVMQDEQAFIYRSSAGERCQLPVKCFEEEPAAAFLATAAGKRLKVSQVKETARVAALAPGYRQTTYGMVADASAQLSAAMTECFQQGSTATAAVPDEQLLDPLKPSTPLQPQTATASDQPQQPEPEMKQQQPANSANGDSSPTFQPASESSSGVAASLAAQTPGRFVSAWEGLQMMGFTAPHLYYRGVARIGQCTLWVLYMIWIYCCLALEVCGVPLQVLAAATKLYGAQAHSWWQARLNPVPDFQEPPSPRKRSRRWASWHHEFLYRVKRKKLLPASIRRHAKRYTEAVHDHDVAVLQHRLVTATTGISLRGLLPLLLLTVTCLLGKAAAVPELLQASRLLTDNLAAWELSQLHKSNFAAAAHYQDLSRSSAGDLLTAASARQFFKQQARPADAAGFPSYPGAVNPLQLDDLLPDGQQFKPMKDSYTPDPDHKWSYGQHPDMNPNQLQQLKDMLVRNKAAFAYSMQELPGYTGTPVSVKLVHDRPIISKPRQYSRLENEIRDEKCQELLDAGFIELADSRNPYASCPTMPAKKNELGEWTERRFRCGLPPSQRCYVHVTVQFGPTGTAVPEGGRQALFILY